MVSGHPAQAHSVLSTPATREGVAMLPEGVTSWEHGRAVRPQPHPWGKRQGPWCIWTHPPQCIGTGYLLVRSRDGCIHSLCGNVGSAPAPEGSLAASLAVARSALPVVTGLKPGVSVGQHSQPSAFTKTCVPSGSSFPGPGAFPDPFSPATPSTPTLPEFTPGPPATSYQSDIPSSVLTAEKSSPCLPGQVSLS